MNIPSQALAIAILAALTLTAVFYLKLRYSIPLSIVLIAASFLFEFDSGSADTFCSRFSTDSGDKVAINDFAVKVRTPCRDGSEYCAAGQRWYLNCFDGDNFKRCLVPGRFGAVDNIKKGDQIILWQIDKKNGEEIEALLPIIDSSIRFEYNPLHENPIFEGLINSKLAGNDYEVLNPNNVGKNPDYRGSVYLNPNDPNQINTFNEGEPVVVDIESFINDANTEPTLKLSLVNKLLGCKDNPISGSNRCANDSGQAYEIPYLEYQILFDSGSNTNSPLSSSNLITVTGEVGSFKFAKTKEVSHASDNLEFVIQQ